MSPRVCPGHSLTEPDLAPALRSSHSGEGGVGGWEGGGRGSLIDKEAQESSSSQNQVLASEGANPEPCSGCWVQGEGGARGTRGQLSGEGSSGRAVEGAGQGKLGKLGGKEAPIRETQA